MGSEDDFTTRNIIEWMKKVCLEEFWNGVYLEEEREDFEIRGCRKLQLEWEREREREREELTGWNRSTEKNEDKKLNFRHGKVAPAPVRVSSQIRQSRLSVNDKGDNEIISCTLELLKYH